MKRDRLSIRIVGLAVLFWTPALQAQRITSPFNQGWRFALGQQSENVVQPDFR